MSSQTIIKYYFLVYVSQLREGAFYLNRLILGAMRNYIFFVFSFLTPDT